MPSVFAMLTGINDYHPQSGVSSLHGCANDVDVMVDYIRRNFPDDPETNIISLKNDAATRENFLTGFKNHLCNNPAIKAGDTVLLYYSGHGSYAPSAKEFIALNEDSKKQDETLVLYDSRLPGKFDLADKELALLLSKIPQHANIVVILDSCHSGSATRNISRVDEIKLGLPRFTPASSTTLARDIADYVEVDGFSYKKLSAEGKLQIPKSKHLLLAACGRDELAYESSSARGLFSSWLTDLLEDAPANATYAQLYENLYTIIKRKANKQTPQLKVYEDFNPRLLFLKSEAGTGKPIYKVVYEKNEWVINYGALHGLPPGSEAINSCQVQLSAANDPAQPLFTIPIKKIGLDESTLIMPPGMDVNQQFVAEIINLPPTLIIYLDGQSVNQLKFLEILKKEKLSSPFITFHKDAAAFYDLALELLDDRLAIRDAKSKQLLHGVKTFVDQSVQYIVDALSQIARWKNLERMANKQSTIPAESFRFALQLLNVAGEWIDADGDDLTFDITKDRPEIPFRIKLANNSDTPYYFALYRLASTFMIEKHSKDNDASLIKKGEEPWLETNVNPGEDPVSFVLDNDDLNEETEIYKLVYSTDPFDDYFVSETRELKREIVDLPKTRGVRGIRKLSRSDWGTRMITIRLVRELQRVNETQGFSNNIISIKPHPSFKAAVSLTPIDSAAKSYNPAKILEDIFDIDNFSIINLSEKSKGDAVPQQTVVELSDIGNEQVLENEPLEININYKLGDDEQVMAVTYSDGLVIPIGLLEKSGDSDLHVMKLHQAPAQMDPRREAGKNPVRALWFCFLKVVLKREDEVFKLRYIEYKNGKPYYPDEGVDDKIKNSTKILLIIHGIIGNTKSIAANMETFLKEGRYDCILSFDYENLNTSISGIALELKKRLEKNGISQNKTIDIVAHSMGGLVTRYMIERLGGDVFVKRLFLVGTPNNGSAFGKLVSMRNWATGVLTLACNYGKQFLGVFGFFLDGVNKVLIATVPITNTLEQMGTGSDFLKDLNEDRGPVQTKYFILAGNTSQYLLNDDAAGKGLMEKIKLAIGKLAYWDVDNDIAVSVSSIKKIPGERAEKVVEMGCHHLNYFDYNPSIKTLREMMN